MEYIERETASRIASIFFTMSMCIDEDECRAMNRAARIIETQIDAIPPANVVEVVRCKDCKYAKYKANKTWIVECVKDADYDEEMKCWYGFTAYHDPDYFCADGVRKDV